MTDQYSPSSNERLNASMRGDFLKVSGDGVFATLQGEGITAGEPSVFLRLQNCNLHCGANGQGWLCDAWYTWDRSTPEYWKELVNIGAEEAAQLIQTSWDNKFKELSCKRLVVTGGEPLLQQRKVAELIGKLDGWKVEIETNGTIVPIAELSDCQFNCSPKLKSSGNKERSRFRPEALNAIAGLPNSWFKFVVGEDSDNDLLEIDAIVQQTDITYDSVILMSEGTEADKLRSATAKLEEIAKGLGCIVTARNQIYWFGNSRAT